MKIKIHLKKQKMEEGLREMTIQSVIANHRPAHAYRAPATNNNSLHKIVHVLPIFIYEIQIISSLACVWSPLPLPEYTDEFQ